MSSSPQFKAEVVFKHEKDGGRLSPPRSGYRPQLEIGDELTSCTISDEMDSVYDFGLIHEVVLSLQFPDRYAHQLKEGDPLVFREGSKKIGEGRISTILPTGLGRPQSI